VEDREEVLRVLVDLRALALREDVLEVERVPAEAVRERRGFLARRRVQVDPGEAVCVELSEPRLAGVGDFRRCARARPLDARQAGHRY
jgi:hypothetical protein